MRWVTFTTALHLLVLLSRGSTSTLFDGETCQSSEQPLRPHPTDCSRYYTCESGRWKLETCISGLLFDPAEERCTSNQLGRCFFASVKAELNSSLSATAGISRRASSLYGVVQPLPNKPRPLGFTAHAGRPISSVPHTPRPGTSLAPPKFPPRSITSHPPKAHAEISSASPDSPSRPISSHPPKAHAEISSASPNSPSRPISSHPPKAHAEISSASPNSPSRPISSHPPKAHAEIPSASPNSPSRSISSHPPKAHAEFPSASPNSPSRSISSHPPKVHAEIASASPNSPSRPISSHPPKAHAEIPFASPNSPSRSISSHPPKAHAEISSGSISSHTHKPRPGVSIAISHLSTPIHLHLSHVMSSVSLLPVTATTTYKPRITSSAVPHNQHQISTMTTPRTHTAMINHRPRPQIALPAKCGRTLRNVIQSRITRGKNTAIEQIPWQVALLEDPSRKPLCGGSVITSRHIITAAHCFYITATASWRTLNDMVVRVGVSDVETRNSSHDLYINEIFTHAKYSYQHHRNDIALLVVIQEIQFTARVYPICLPRDSNTTKYSPGRKCVASGWGDTRRGSSSTSRLLQSTDIPLVQQQECQHIYPNRITRGMTCAGDLIQGGVDTCQGDSGGPLACQDGARFFLYGITSWGVGCGAAGKPGVYTKVTKYHKWIIYKIALSEWRLKSNVIDEDII